jgi:hypothetical protein
VGGRVGLVARRSYSLRLLRAVLSATRLTQTPREGTTEPGMGGFLDFSGFGF